MKIDKKNRKIKICTSYNKKVVRALREKTAAADKATALAAEMKAAVEKSLKEKGQAVEKAAAEMKAAKAAKSAADEEKARAALEVKAAKVEVREGVVCFFAPG